MHQSRATAEFAVPSYRKQHLFDTGMSLDFLKNCSLIQDDPAYKDCELIHFRLTDSALRGLERLASTLGEDTFKLSFSEKEKSFILPFSSRPSKFTYSVSSLNSVADGCLDCLNVDGGRIRCLGKVVSRFTVDAKEDSFSMAKKKMVLLEDENRKQQTKELNTSKRKSSKSNIPQGDHKKSNKARPDVELSTTRPQTSLEPSTQATSAPSTFQLHRQHSNSPAASAGCGPSPPLPNHAVSIRPLRERVIHLLALRPYGRAELLLRLSRDGLSTDQKDQLDHILTKVGRVARGSAFSLAPSVIPELDPHWPGYSASEKNRITSLKSSKRMHSSPYENSPSNTHRSHTTSPVNSAATVKTPRQAEDQFSRRPTRASAPVAPHSLSKKITALDLLSAGIDEDKVAGRVGVSRELLNQWRSNEAELRERFRRSNSNSHSDSRVSPVAATVSCNASRSEAFTVHPGPVQTPSGFSFKGNPSSVSPIADTSISPPKRARLESASDRRSKADITDQSNSVSPQTTTLARYTAKSKSRAPSAQPVVSHNSDSDRQSHRFSLLDDADRSQAFSPSSLQDSLSHNLYTQPQPSRFCGVVGGGGGGGGTGSEGESASHTPCSNVSSAGSVEGVLTAAQPVANGRYGSGFPADRDLPRARAGSAVLSGPSLCDMDSDNYSVSVPRRSDLSDAHEFSARKSQPAGVSDSFSHYDTAQSTKISSQLAEIERLYPKICSKDQAELYRAEFESTYPTYLRMFHSFPDIWKNVDRLRAQLLDAAKHEMLDSPASGELAAQLDELLERTRTQKYRDDLAQLTLITHKLRLLKHRLMETNQHQAGTNQPGPRYSSKDSTRSHAMLHSTKTSVKPTNGPIGHGRKVGGAVEHFSGRGPVEARSSEPSSTRIGRVDSNAVDFDYHPKKLSSRAAIV
ncbi:RNA polymerase II elongation factor ELL [Paragonimus westermani]|uniref:RNA polymerase II elongation factor ELL n=1 Tax=Paragonimus westermani TaxID=34504 RepID=A0A5J4NRN7_9TREM|nr:RNA polymerase II elongation factor ELL [Paragonimus westermani]